MTCPCFSGVPPTPYTRCFHCDQVIDDSARHTEHRLLHHDGPETRAASTIAVEVYKQEAEDYEASAIAWIKSSKVTKWEKRLVDLSEIDFSNASNWPASKNKTKIAKFIDAIKNKGYNKRVLLVKRPEHKKFMVVDGHHRSLAWRKLKKPVPAFIGHLTQERGPWDKMHNVQIDDKDKDK